MTYYLSPAKDAAKAAEAEIFAAFRERIRAIDPEAIAEDGSIVGRNAATGELMPDATRTTGYYGEPAPAVQGFVIPVPEDSDLHLADPVDTGVEVTVHINPWPVIGPAGAPPPLPEWRQPQNASEVYPVGMWVTHNGTAYRSLLPGNDQEPAWPSLFWQAVPEPTAPDWVKPTGYQNVFPRGAVVTHNGQQWESLIAANNEEPGADATNRYWAPRAAGDGPAEWSQPMPGGHRPYGAGEECLRNGRRWRSKAHLNVWEPAEGALWEEVT